MSFWGTRPSPFTTAEGTFLQSLADHSYTDGQLIIGNSATGGVSFGTITQGSGVTITNGNGTITISASGGSASLVVGSSTITSGTTTRILYDNAGVLGEYTISGSGTVVAMATNPSFTTPTLGAATATSINKVAITAPATSATLTIADGKTLTVSNTLTLAGTDSTTMTFPTTSATIARTDAANTFTGHQTIEGVTSTGATGTGKLVFDTAPTLSNPIVGTQAASDNSTKGASTAYVTTAIANAIAGVNPAVAVQAATTAAGDTSGLTYNNGVSGVGATFTGSNNTALTIDGFTFTTLGQRLLVKNDTQSPSGAFNGVYYVTQVQTAILPPILTRALDYDMPSDINNTGAIPVVNGTVNATTSWLLTSAVTTVGTDPLTYVQFSRNPTSVLPANLGGTGIANNVASTLTISGSFGTTLTVTGTTSVTLPTSGTLVSSVTTGNGVSATNTAGALAFTLGAITPTTVNGNTFTTGSYTLTGTAGKTLTFSNSITLAGTDGTTMTFPASSDTVVGLAATQTITGIKTFSPTLRSSGSSSYFIITTPADTGQTAATESIGIKTITATRTWATTGTVALQREIYLAGPTYASASASQTFTDAATLYIDKPIAGTNAIFTRGHSLVIVDSTSAASAITGGFVIATTLGTSATSVGIGGGNINAGGTLIVGGHVTFEGITSTGATGTNLLVFATSPTLTTPNIGLATSTSVIYTNNAVTASGNAATVPVTSRLTTVTNNSAATLTITITTAGATDGQLLIVRILDFSAVAETITWVNTENSTVSVPTTSNGSTTLFLTVGFIYNGGTSKWRCVASA